MKVIKNDSISKILQAIRLCVQDTQLPVGNMYFQAEAPIHTYGVLPIVDLSKTYSGVYQLKYELTNLGKAQRACCFSHY